MDMVTQDIMMTELLHPMDEDGVVETGKDAPEKETQKKEPEES